MTQNAILPEEKSPAEAPRRVHPKSIARRQRILDAAARALAENGYADAKLSEIAQEAGTHAGSLYYYFASREELVKEVLLKSLDRLVEFAESPGAGRRPLDRILAFVRLIIEQALAPDDHYFRAYLRNGNQVPDAIREVVQARRRQMRRTLAALLRSAQDDGEIAAGIDPEIAAQFILGATNWVGTWYSPSGRHSVEAIVGTFSALVLNGLLHAEGSMGDCKLD